MTKKLLGNERRKWLIEQLQRAKEPIPGRTLGDLANVSRQVIVGDVTLLKAQGHPIIATSRGYVYVEEDEKTTHHTKTIVCQHPPEETEEELFIFVDNGCTVKDVRIEHPVYGDLSASIMVSNRREVEQFIEKIRAADASFLLDLAHGGVHLHTVEAETKEDIIQAEKALKHAGYLVESSSFDG